MSQNSLPFWLAPGNNDVACVCINGSRQLTCNRCCSGCSDTCDKGDERVEEKFHFEY